MAHRPSAGAGPLKHPSLAVLRAVVSPRPVPFPLRAAAAAALGAGADQTVALALKAVPARRSFGPRIVIGHGHVRTPVDPGPVQLAPLTLAAAALHPGARHGVPRTLEPDLACSPLRPVAVALDRVVGAPPHARPVLDLLRALAATTCSPLRACGGAGTGTGVGEQAAAAAPRIPLQMGRPLCGRQPLLYCVPDPQKAPGGSAGNRSTNGSPVTISRGLALFRGAGRMSACQTTEDVPALPPSPRG